MSSKKRFELRNNPFNSLFVKCTLMMMVCVVSVVAAITVNEAHNKKTLTAEALSARAVEVTGLLSKQLGGAVKFGNEPAIADAVTEVIDNARPDSTGAYLLAANGNVLYTSLEPTEDPQPIADLAAEAMQNGAVATSENGLVAAFPIFFGDANEIVGSVVTSWDKTYIMANLGQAQARSLMIGGAVMGGGLFLSALFLLTQMSRPLLRIEAAMRKVAEEEYDVAVPFTGRKDEVGKMARRLDKFRIALGDAKEAERESAFKSAAFGGSGASMMMVDENLDVIFVNPSCESFLCSLKNEMECHWTGFEAESAVGANLGNFAPLAASAQAVLSEGKAALPITLTIKLDQSLVRISMNSALNDEGEMIGAVLQWSDRTEATRNTALLDAIDKNQLRFECNSDGVVESANANFLKMCNLSEAEMGQLSLKDLISAMPKDGSTGDGILHKLRAEEPVSGQFEVRVAECAQAFIVDGSFAGVLTPEGMLERVIFLGSDVTESARAIPEAEELRERVSREQEIAVKTLGTALNKLAEGDLSCGITGDFPADYEMLRQDFNLAVKSLENAITAVVHNTVSIRNETKEIASAADDLSRRTEKQAATLEETAAALDELTSSVKSAAQGADEAADISSKAQQNAEDGGNIAKRAVSAMNGIKNSSEEISKITSVIDDIAFQTNLLALNAGVEAARAGEAGRGFAVVATEVRGLAQRSSDAAREINGLISTSEQQVQQGVALVDQTGAALSEIVISVSEISQRVSSIAGSTREQSVGLNEINVAVNDLDHVTQQNAAMFEETTAASHALMSETDALAKAVSRFKLGSSGAAKQAAQDREIDGKITAVPAVRGNLALQSDDSSQAQTGWEDF